MKIVSVGVDFISDSKKIAAIILVIAIVLNLVLFATGNIDQMLFWIVIAVIGIIAYKVVPKLN